MDEGIFPGVRSFMEPAALEEERRLCYVAITRAKEELYMSNAHMRTMYGKINSYMPSRFIEEIPPDLVDKVINNIIGGDPFANLYGKVVSVTGSGKKMILKIEFPGNKMRSLMVAFAPITKGNE